MTASLKNAHDIKAALRFLTLLEEEIREAQSLPDVQNKAILERLVWSRETLTQAVQACLEEQEAHVP
jgi:hypothetical protein